jgi:hypothetical protein
VEKQVRSPKEVVLALWPKERIKPIDPEAEAKKKKAAEKKAAEKKKNEQKGKDGKKGEEKKAAGE